MNPIDRVLKLKLVAPQAYHSLRNTQWMGYDIDKAICLVCGLKPSAANYKKLANAINSISKAQEFETVRSFITVFTDELVPLLKQMGLEVPTDEINTEGKRIAASSNKHISQSFAEEVVGKTIAQDFRHRKIRQKDVDQFFGTRGGRGFPTLSPRPPKGRKAKV